MSTPADRRRRSLWLVSAALLAFAALCVLGVLVDRGALAGVDGYAVRHLMPFESGPGTGATNVLEQAFAVQSGQLHVGEVIRIPASAAGSCLVVVVLTALLWRRGRRALAFLWLLGFATAVLVEGFCKRAISKPPLYAFEHGALRPQGFVHSFPSGHATRAAIIAAIAVTLWPRLWPIFAGWLLAVIVSAELDGVHTPSDIAGGLLLASAVTLAVLGLADRFEAPLEARLRAPGRRARPAAPA